MTLALACSVVLSAEAPAGQAFEAEAHRVSDSVTAEDPEASGGKVVTNDKAWQPLSAIDATELEDGTDAFVLHVRHRGGPLLFKGRVGGRQVQFAELYKKPTTLSWSRVGPVTREEIGERLTVLRGNADVALDAIVLEPVGGAPAAPALPPERPDDEAEAVPVGVSIDWSRSVVDVPQDIFGVNEWKIVSDSNPGSSILDEFVDDLRPPTVRLHHGSFPRRFARPDGTLDDEALVEAFASAPSVTARPLMLNVSTWPETLTESDLDLLRSDATQAWVDFLLDMRRALDDAGVDVAMWELPNEKAKDFDRRGRLDDLWPHFNVAADALREAQPGLLVGGPALTHARPDWVGGFLEHCLSHADFVTYHNYGVGKDTDSNEKLYNALDAIEADARRMRRSVDEAAEAQGIGRRVPIYLTEYNVKWTWEPIDRRHANSVGAVFHGCLLRRVAAAGIDGAHVWNAVDNAYGIVGHDGVERATAALFRWGPNHLTGPMLHADVDAPHAVEAWASRDDQGRRALMILNKSDRSATLPPLSELMPGATPAFVGMVGADGVRTATSTVDPDEPTQLRGYSYTIFSERPADDNDRPPIGPEQTVMLADPDALAARRGTGASDDIARRIIAQADAALDAPLRSVTDKVVDPPSGNRHDYQSIGIYWWPDPAQADGLPWVRRDGERNPATSAGENSDSGRLADMADDVESLAGAWWLTGEAKIRGEGGGGVADVVPRPDHPHEP